MEDHMSETDEQAQMGDILDDDAVPDGLDQLPDEPGEAEDDA